VNNSDFKRKFAVLYGTGANVSLLGVNVSFQGVKRSLPLVTPSLLGVKCLLQGVKVSFQGAKCSLRLVAQSLLGANGARHRPDEVGRRGVVSPACAQKKMRTLLC